MTERGGKKTASAEQVIIDEFIKDLETTADQVQQLLTEIRDSKIDLATIKAEFRFVVDNVKLLSSIVKDGESSSVLTRLAVIEAGLLDLKEEIKIRVNKNTEDNAILATKIALLELNLNNISTNVEEIKEEEAPQIEEVTGKWQLYVAIAGGIFTLLGSIAALIMSIWGK